MTSAERGAAHTPTPVERRAMLDRIIAENWNGRAYPDFTRVLGADWATGQPAPNNVREYLCSAKRVFVQRFGDVV